MRREADESPPCFTYGWEMPDSVTLLPAQYLTSSGMHPTSSSFGIFTKISARSLSSCVPATSWMIRMAGKTAFFFRKRTHL